jgi:hypothetical protein
VPPDEPIAPRATDESKARERKEKDKKRR